MNGAFKSGGEMPQVPSILSMAASGQGGDAMTPAEGIDEALELLREVLEEGASGGKPSVVASGKTVYRGMGIEQVLVQNSSGTVNRRAARSAVAKTSEGGSEKSALVVGRTHR